VTTDSHNIPNQVESSGFNEHNMLIYPDLNTFSETYVGYAKKHLNPHYNEIVVIVTHYQPIDKVLLNLSDAGIDVDHEQKAGNLVILDSVASYQADENHSYVLNLAKSLVKRAADEGKGGVCVFGDIGSFFLFDRIMELMQYEMSIPPRPGLKLKAFCCYHQGDYGRLSDAEKNTLAANHFRKIQPQN
jgi:hypothetical protein